jgi:hypothetical protein
MDYKLTLDTYEYLAMTTNRLFNARFIGIGKLGKYF